MARRRRKNRLRAAGRMAEPRSAERAYMRSLRSVFVRINSIIEKALEPIFGSWPQDDRPRADDVITIAMISRQLELARIDIGELLTIDELTPILDAAGRSVDSHTTRELGRVLGIDIRRSSTLAGLIDTWRQSNIDLIESSILGPIDGVKLRPLLDDVSDVVESAHMQGLRVEVLRRQLQERFEISERRAELIAHDQTLKLNGQINQHRQREVGVTQYRWRAVGDERTRPRHMELDGTIQSWDAPPEVAPGRFEHPGGDFNCRCGADPMLPDWLG